MTVAELLEYLAQQPSNAANLPSNAGDVVQFVASQPIGSISISTPSGSTPEQNQIIETMNGLISGLQDLIAYQNSQTVLVQIPPQTDKGILTNTTREKQLLNIIAFNKETINSFYSRLLFWNQNVDPKLLYKVNLICTRDAVDYWIGIDDYLMLLSAFGSNYTNERKDNWGEDKVIP
jgi:hypothetical protein